MDLKQWLIAILVALLIGGIAGLAETRFGEFTELQRGVVRILQLAVGVAVLTRRETR